MKILALETASEACSVALWIDGEIQERYELADRRHTQLLLPMVDTLMAEAELSISALDCIAFGQGPGSFTGLRIACSVAQGLAFGADLPIAPVSSLAALAQGVWRQQQAEHVLAAFDARMGELYYGQYSLADGLMELSGAEQLATAADLALPAQGQWTGAGEGWATYAEPLTQRMSGHLVGVIPEARPAAQDVAVLATEAPQVAAEQALPVYLRNQVAHQGRK